MRIIIHFVTKLVTKLVFSWLNTEPKIKSDKAIKLETAGLMWMLIDAIEQERKGLPQTGNITVCRVGLPAVERSVSSKVEKSTEP